MQGARRSEWLFRSQAAPRRRPFVCKPCGAVMLCAHCGVARRLFGITKPRAPRSLPTE